MVLVLSSQERIEESFLLSPPTRVDAEEALHAGDGGPAALVKDPLREDRPKISGDGVEGAGGEDQDLLCVLIRGMGEWLASIDPSAMLCLFMRSIETKDPHLPTPLARASSWYLSSIRSMNSGSPHRSMQSVPARRHAVTTFWRGVSWEVCWYVGLEKGVGRPVACGPWLERKRQAHQQGLPSHRLAQEAVRPRAVQDEAGAAENGVQGTRLV